MTMTRAVKKTLSLLLFILIALRAGTHEFWLEPDRFQLKPGQQIRLRFNVGENFTGDDWTGNRQLVDKLKVYFHDLDDDLEDQVSDSTGDSLNLQFYLPGTVLIAFQSKNKHIELPANKFNEYLADDGLDLARAMRIDQGETDSVGREHYQRSVKTLLQVGDQKTDNYKKRTGLPLDIVPLNHPYHIKKSGNLRLKVYFHDAPLPNHLVRIWQRVNGKVTSQRLTTDAQGEIEVTVHPIGQWMASLVEMERAAPTDSVQWQSYWGSLTWGY